MRTRFDQQLDALNTELVTMGTLCENAISMAIKALIDGDSDLRERVYSVAAEASQKERDIERICMKLLLQQQPVAKDLRTISSALKMIYDMERIGILASDIAEISQFVRYTDIDDGIQLKNMTVAAIKMVTDSIEAFVKKDLPLAESVELYDDVVDDYFDEIKRALIETITEHRAHSEACIDLLMIAKYLEKIGDHAVNIADWVIYSLSGRHKQ
ncbi:MAG: phosphate signaling complex protein PhoU [Clostridia bacterium]|nr:phosphate signaling complex protein PhoU [Clostridia bacterium]